MYRSRLLAVVLGLTLALAMVVTACAPAAQPPAAEPTKASATVPTAVPPAAPEEIRVGVNETMTGGGAPYGDMTWKGIQLAHEKQPTVLGRPVKLVLVDNKTDKTEAALAAQRLVDVEKVVAVLGPDASSVTMAQNEVLEKAKIPSIATAATNPLVTQGKRYAFRVCFIDPFQGAAAAKYAVEQLGAKKAALLVDITQDYGVGLANFFKAKFIELNGGDESCIVTNQSFQSGDRDFTAQLTAIKALAPDIIFAPDEYAELGAILQQAKQLGVTPGIKFLGGDSADVPELVEIAKDAAEGFAYTAQFHPDAYHHPEAIEFATNFKNKYGADGETFSVTGYDAYLLLMDAIERAGSADPEAITDALAQTKGWVGARGAVTINENHDGELAAPVIVIKDGKKVFATLAEP